MDRKQQIIQLAQMMVRQRGFDSFSYKDLSDQLGIRRASIHHHFPSKDDLGVALIDNMISWIGMRFEEMDKSGMRSSEMLDEVLAIMRTGCEHGCICPVASLQTSGGVLSERMQTRLDLLEDAELQAFRMILVKGREEGTMNFDGEIDGMARIVSSVIKGATLYGRRHGTQAFEGMIVQLKRILKTR